MGRKVVTHSGDNKHLLPDFSPRKQDLSVVYRFAAIWLVMCSYFWLGVLPAIAEDSSQKNSTYYYGVFPYVPVASIEEIHAPIAKRFSKILDHPVIVESRPTFELFRDAVEGQRYDIIYIQPFGYIRSAAPSGYIPLARFVSSGDKEFTGTIKALFVTLSKSSLDRLDQLEHKVVAMPSAEAAVSVLGVAYLKEHGLVDGHNIEIKYHKNHFSCLQQLIIQKASACVSALPAVKLFESDKNLTLKIFATSQAIPSSLIAVHRRIPRSKRLQLQKEILSWKTTIHGREILKRGKWLGYIRADDKDYDTVRNIWKEVRENE